jgi:hypothetical protein
VRKTGTKDHPGIGQISVGNHASGDQLLDTRSVA